jgi:hypothetical protein
MDIARGDDAASVGVVAEATESGKMNTLWVCEKWSEDAVNFARKRLRHLGKSHVQDGNYKEFTGEMTWDNNLQAYVPAYRLMPRMIEVARGVTSDWLRLLVGEAEEVQEVYGNLLLNEGIQEIWDLTIAFAGTTAYNNANADIGTGDSATAAVATQTDLQAATNKLFKGMVATYPIRTNQTVDFRSDFTTAEGNYAWEEWSVRNGVTRNKNMNRKVQSLGTKTTGTWTLTASLTLS